MQSFQIVPKKSRILQQSYRTARSCTKHSKKYVLYFTFSASTVWSSCTQRKIRIRLHGTRLPKDYTLSIRLLTSENRHDQPAQPSRKRRRKPSMPNETKHVTPPTSDLEEDNEVTEAHPASMDASASALEREIAEQEDEEVRRTNAYPGATNDIGSIYQRRWFLSMDRYLSGFRPLRVEKGSTGGRRQWVRRQDGERRLGYEPFFVMGREVERSVLTGRTADEVMADEGVEGFGKHAVYMERKMGSLIPRLLSWQERMESCHRVANGHLPLPLTCNADLACRVWPVHSTCSTWR